MIWSTCYRVIYINVNFFSNSIMLHSNWSHLPFLVLLTSHGSWQRIVKSQNRSLHLAPFESLLLESIKEGASCLEFFLLVFHYTIYEWSFKQAHRLAQANTCIQIIQLNDRVKELYTCVVNEILYFVSRRKRLMKKLIMNS